MCNKTCWDCIFNWRTDCAQQQQRKHIFQSTKKREKKKGKKTQQITLFIYKELWGRGHPLCAWAGTSHLLLPQWGGEQDTSRTLHTQGFSCLGLGPESKQLETLKEAVMRKARGSSSKGRLPTTFLGAACKQRFLPSIPAWAMWCSSVSAGLECDSLDLDLELQTSFQA